MDLKKYDKKGFKEIYIIYYNMKSYLHKLPQEVFNKIYEYIPIERDIESKLTVFMDFRKLKFEMGYQETIFDEEGIPEEEREFGDPNMTFFEYYFKHDYNHKHKYRKCQV